MATRPDLPLFDLPLHGDLDDEPPQAEDQAILQKPTVQKPAVQKPTVQQPVPAEAGRGASQSRLFEDEPSDEDHDESHDERYEESYGESEPDEEPLDEDQDVGVLDRLIGGVIDVSIHAAVLLAVGSATWLIGVRPATEDWPAFSVFLLLFSLLYAGVPLAFWGQTPGMMRVGHVARTGSGEPLTFGQTALRWFGALLTLALLGLPLLLALGASSRSLADRLSGSYTEAA